MNVPEWFALGVGIAGALYAWHHMVRRVVWEWSEEPPNLWGILGGTALTIVMPLWLPVYAGVVVWKRYRVRDVVLKALPKPQ